MGLTTGKKYFKARKVLSIFSYTLFVLSKEKAKGNLQVKALSIEFKPI